MIDFSEVYKAIDDTVSFFEHEEEEVAAQVIRKRVIDRTLNGVDVNGVPFIPYKPPYSRLRQRRGLPITPVDLWALGNPHLLESIFHTSEHTLWFPPEFIPIAQGNQTRREFFGANDSDWKAAADAMAIAYNEKR